MDSSKGTGWGMALRLALERANEASTSASQLDKPDTTPEVSYKGLSRGIALRLALQRAKEGSTSASQQDAPETTAGTSILPIGVSYASSPGGAVSGAAQMMSKLQEQESGMSLKVTSEPILVTLPTGSILSTASGDSPGAASMTTSNDDVRRAIMRLQLFNLRNPSSMFSRKKDRVSVSSEMAGHTASGTSAATIANKQIRNVKGTETLMHRPQGKPVEVTPNLIRLNSINEDNVVFEYEVRYSPEQEYQHLRFRLLNEHKHYFETNTFDGTSLYVPHMLPDEALNLVSTNPYDESKINIRIDFLYRRRLSELTHIYNDMFKSIMEDLEIARCGRRSFIQRPIMIPQLKLELWPGYILEAEIVGIHDFGLSDGLLNAIGRFYRNHAAIYSWSIRMNFYVTAVEEYDGSHMVTLDSSNCYLNSQTALSFIKEAVNSQDTYSKKDMYEILIGCWVLTTHNKKLFRIDSVDFKMNPRSMFVNNANGYNVRTSFIDHYKSYYGVQIMDWDQPMLISRETKVMPDSNAQVHYTIYLVPELCKMTAFTGAKHNTWLIKDVVTYAPTTPDQRLKAFKQYIRNIMRTPNARSRLEAWGLSLAQETIDILTIEPTLEVKERRSY